MGKKSRRNRKKMTEEEKKERHDGYNDMIEKEKRKKEESELLIELLNEFSKREDEKFLQQKKFLCEGTIDVNLDLTKIDISNKYFDMIVYSLII